MSTEGCGFESRSQQQSGLWDKVEFSFRAMPYRDCKSESWQKLGGIWMALSSIEKTMPSVFQMFQKFYWNFTQLDSYISKCLLRAHLIQVCRVTNACLLLPFEILECNSQKWNRNYLSLQSWHFQSIKDFWISRYGHFSLQEQNKFQRAISFEIRHPPGAANSSILNFLRISTLLGQIQCLAY